MARRLVVQRQSDEDRIQVEFPDLRNFFNETRHSQQRFFQGVKIGRWMPSIAGKQPIAFDPSNHFRGVAVSKGRDAELYIAENLDVNPAEAKRNQRTE